MLTKVGDTLPQKDAHAFKQLAVKYLLNRRNFMTLKIIRKDWNMRINCCKHILIILKQFRWRLCLSLVWGSKTKPLKLRRLDWWRVRWRVCSVGIRWELFTNKKEITSSHQNVSKTLTDLNLTTSSFWKTSQLCKSKSETIQPMSKLA